MVSGLTTHVVSPIFQVAESSQKDSIGVVIKTRLEKALKEFVIINRKDT